MYMYVIRTDEIFDTDSKHTRLSVVDIVVLFRYVSIFLHKFYVSHILHICLLDVDRRNPMLQSRFQDNVS